MNTSKTLLHTFAYVLLSLSLLSSVAALAAVDLGSADGFIILAKTGISTTGVTMITGDIGVSPIDGTGVTGFGLTMDASNEFATSAIVTGQVYAADYAPPTPTTMTTAISDMETAYTDAAGRTLPDATELGAGNIGGMTLAPGLYKWGTGVIIPTDVTLAGGANDVWIFQIAQTLDISSATAVVLSGGARAENIFWQVGGQTTIDTDAVFTGIILSQTAIVLNTGAVLNGKAFAQTAVTLDAATVSSQSSASPSTSGSGSGTPSTNDGASGSSSGSSGGPEATWTCSAWSACSADGERTKICTQVIGGASSSEKERCTPPQPVVAPSTIDTDPSDTDPSTPLSNTGSGATIANVPVFPLWAKVSAIVVGIALLAMLALVATRKRT